MTVCVCAQCVPSVVTVYWPRCTDVEYRRRMTVVWSPCTGQDVQTQDDSLSTYITQAGKVRVWAEPSRFFAPHVCCPWSGCNKDRARWCERPNRGKLLPVPKLERVEESAWQCQEPQTRNWGREFVSHQARAYEVRCQFMRGLVQKGGEDEKTRKLDMGMTGHGRGWKSELGAAKAWSKEGDKCARVCWWGHTHLLLSSRN